MWRCHPNETGYPPSVTIEAIKAELEALPAEEQRRLAAFLVSLRHRDQADYRAELTRRIDDQDPGNWVNLEEFEERLDS